MSYESGTRAVERGSRLNMSRLRAVLALMALALTASYGANSTNAETPVVQHEYNPFAEATVQASAQDLESNTAQPEPSIRPLNPEHIAERLRRQDSLEPSVVQEARFQDEVVVSGLNFPTTMRFAPDGTIFVAEKSGIIKSIEKGVERVIADLRERVMDYWDRGLLGLELHPDFPTSPYVYVLYAKDGALGQTPPVFRDNCDDPTGTGCVVSGVFSRFTLDDSGAMIPGSEEVQIEDWCQQGPSHSVGDVRAGSDGAMYVSGGEGANFAYTDYGQGGNPCGDPYREGGSLRSQDAQTSGDPLGLSGTIIRVDPDTGRPMFDNPNGASDDENRGRIIATGLRNPYRFTIDRQTGKLYVADVGNMREEEINVLPIASTTVPNFGWPAYEGNDPSPEFAPLNLRVLNLLYATEGTERPFYRYSHYWNGAWRSAAITGIALYRGSGYPPEYDGALFFADYAQGKIFAMMPGSDGKPDPNTIRTMIAGATAISLVNGPGGDIYYVDLSGEIHRIRFYPENTPPTAVIAADKTNGPTPLTVNFTGAGSTDPDGDSLIYSWDFNGDGTPDASGPEASTTYGVGGVYSAMLTVADEQGASHSATLEVNANNTPPVINVASPQDGAEFRVGDSVQFDFSATDAESGVLPPESFIVEVTIEHCPSDCHDHPVTTYVGVTNGVFSFPDHGDQGYRLRLDIEVTDPGGLTSIRTLRLGRDRSTATPTVTSTTTSLPTQTIEAPTVPTAQATVTVVPSPTATSTATPTLSFTTIPSATSTEATPTATETATETAQATSVLSPTATPSPTPGVFDTPSPPAQKFRSYFPVVGS